jgi:hypothetical protein
MRSFLLSLIAVLTSGVTIAQQQKGIEVTWLGHAAFEVVSAGGTRLLIDPFLTYNPTTPAANKDLAQYKPNAILVSHSHADHAGNAVEIAKASGAPIVGSYDYVSSLAIPDSQKMGGNVGGRFMIGEMLRSHSSQRCMKVSLVEDRSVLSCNSQTGAHSITPATRGSLETWRLFRSCINPILCSSTLAAGITRKTLQRPRWRSRNILSPTSSCRCTSEHFQSLPRKIR